MDRNGKNAGQRNAVRASTRVLFAFKEIEEAAFAAIAEDYRRGISFYNQEGLSETQMYVAAQNALANIRERDADMGAFLHLLDTKLNVLLQKVLKGSSPFEKLSLKKVNISATGIAFTGEQKFAAGQIVALHLALLPEYNYIFAYAKILKAEALPEPQEGERYRLFAEFILITEGDREMIVQHNFKQQSLALRNRRLKV